MPSDLFLKEINFIGSKIKLLFIRQIPPPEGGVTVLVRLLVDELKGYSQFELIEINLVSSKRMAQKFFLHISNLIRLFFKSPKADLITYQVSSNTFELLGPFVYWIARLWSKPLVVRRFAGDCIIKYENYPKPFRWIIRKTVLSADICFYETRQQVQFFSRISKNRVMWFSNYRKLPQMPIRRKYHACKFVYLGLVSKEKGINILIQAFEGLNQSIFLDIYGRDVMNVNNFITSSNIKYKGFLDNSKVYEVLSEYDALIIPSFRSAEGYPGVIIEAYMVNIPVIATTIPGIMEIVIDKEIGLLFSPGDVQELREAILKLHTDRGLYSKMIRNIRNQKSKFSKEYWTQYFVNEIEKLYSSQNRD